MTNICLLGAGFSRNWGGLLAQEVFEHLIGMEEIRRDEYLRRVLWDSKNAGGFENALSEVQINARRDPGQYEAKLRTLQACVLRAFQGMNDAFLAMPGMEFQQFRESMLSTFLARFDAIFTLNQDLLLEHHYVPQVALIDPRRWNGAQLPGMTRIPDQVHPEQPSWGRDTWIPMEPARFSVENRLQPIFKLHGSTNWRVGAGDLLVIGGDKSRAIREHQVLAWTYDKFREYCAMPNARLMVIGYGFRDPHINEVIIEAIQRGNLRMFVVDPLGSELARHANPSFGGSIYAPNALDDAFRVGLAGASQRSLRETFGGDAVSHRQVSGFLQ